MCGEGSAGRGHAVAWVAFRKVKGVPEPCVHVPVMVLPSELSLPSQESWSMPTPNCTVESCTVIESTQSPVKS